MSQPPVRYKIEKSIPESKNRWVVFMVKVVIDPNKSVHENAAVYFEKAKKLKRKLADAEKAVAETKKEIEAAKKRAEKQKVEEEKKKAERTEEALAPKKEWFRQFRWFFSSEGFLAVGGKSADQNELVVKKYLEPDDLFFHADIRGGSVIILKNGVTASDRTRAEAAQFAASYSNAWKEGYAAIDVYAVRREQVSKTPPSGEYLEKGSFAISGERQWFKGTALALLVGRTASGVEVVPEKTGTGRFSVCFEVVPGDKEKEIVAKELGRKLDCDASAVNALLPAGKISFKRVK